MTIEKYIKTYCDNQYRVYMARREAGKIIQIDFHFAAYEDIYTYKDIENDVVFEDRFSIGD